MYILIALIKCNKICASRFIDMNNVHTVRNFTKLNIKIYIWTIVFHLHDLFPSSCMTAFIRKGLFFLGGNSTKACDHLALDQWNELNLICCVCLFIWFSPSYAVTLVRRIHISNQDMNHPPMNQPNTGSAPSTNFNISPRHVSCPIHNTHGFYKSKCFYMEK